MSLIRTALLAKMRVAYMSNSSTNATMPTAGEVLDAVTGTVASVAGTAVASLIGHEAPTEDGAPGVANNGLVLMTDASNATNTGPSWIDSTFRTADATLWVFSIIGSIFLILALRGDHFTIPSIKMASAPLLGIVTFFEAIFISNLWAYWFHLAPCVFTECLINAEDPGSAAGVAAVLFIVFWSIGFILLVGMKLAGWRGVSLFEVDTDELTGMFGGM